MPLSGILGGFESHKKQIFEIFEGKNSGKIGNYRKKSEILGKNWTNEISVHFFFEAHRKTIFRRKIGRKF